MKAYRFIAKVSETGTIQIPYHPSLFTEEVEVVILPKSEAKAEKARAATFVDKWAGVLSETDADTAKLKYLSDKYK